MEISIILNNLYTYIFLVCITGYLLLKDIKPFNKEQLIDYLIYLTSKIILFVCFNSFIIVAILTLLNIEYNAVNYYIQDMFKALLYYATFNYAIFYLIKFVSWFVDFYKDNDLMHFAISKKEGGTK